MIAACKARIEALLAAQDPPVSAAQIFRDKAALERHGPLPRVVLVAGGEKTSPMGDLVGVETDQEAGVRRYTYRRKRRELRLTIVVMAHSDEAAEAILTSLIGDLEEGFELDAQPVMAWETASDWLEEQSVMRNESIAHTAVQFEGGIYRTREVPLIPDIAVEAEVM